MVAVLSPVHQTNQAAQSRTSQCSRSTNPFEILELPRVAPSKASLRSTPRYHQVESGCF